MLAKSIFAALAAAAYLFIFVAAECPNACSSHGKCGAFDACQCYRNWMASDCSERICQFALAHVDTPKGDLDSSSGKLFAPNGKIGSSNADIIVGDQMYPYGTVEQYPDVHDTEGRVVTNSAHEYRECANKGICDRAAGTCTCLEGYDGSACQRASCPSSSAGTCSGHGVCLRIKDIAKLDNDNIYRLWDESATMGCVCDKGFYGPDCSKKACKNGYDPLYIDTSSTSNSYRYSNWTFAIYNLFSTSDPAKWDGNYSIVFYDAFGEDWVTRPIGINEKCDWISQALESLPNNVIPNGTVRCSYDVLTAAAQNYVKEGTDQLRDGFPIAKLTTTPTVKAKFTLAFPQNPGKLRQPEINYFLDGTRPTLVTDEVSATGYSSSGSTLSSWVFPNGFSGEDYDYFPDLCAGVTVTLMDPASVSVHGTLGGLDVQSTKALKRCLGDSDGDLTTNKEVYNWDYGNYNPATGISGANSLVSGVAIGANPQISFLKNPHIIKLIDTTKNTATRLCDTTSNSLTGTPYSTTSTWNAGLLGLGWCADAARPGFYAVVYYDETNLNFKVINRVWEDYAPTTTFNVYTTTGYLKLVSPFADVFTVGDGDADSVDYNSYYAKTLYSTNNTAASVDNIAPEAINNYGYTGAVDCETMGNSPAVVFQCLEKGDNVIVLNTAISDVDILSNPRYINMYKVNKIFLADMKYWWRPDSMKVRHRIELDMSANFRHVKSNTADTTYTAAQIYKFFPPANKYKYVGQCSNRGICNTDEGLCECFAGYTSDNCGTLNALAV